MPRSGPEPVARRVSLRANLDAVPSSSALWREDEAPIDDLAERLRALVAEVLTERQRMIVEMHFFEGLSQGEIARRLGITQQVVQKALHGDARNGRRVGGALQRLRLALAR